MKPVRKVISASAKEYLEAAIDLHAKFKKEVGSSLSPVKASDRLRAYRNFVFDLEDLFHEATEEM